MVIRSISRSRSTTDAQPGALGRHLIPQPEHQPFLLFEVADQRFAGVDLFAEGRLARLALGLALEHVFFEFLHPEASVAPFLVQERMLLVQRRFPTLDFLAFGAEMGGDLARLAQDLFFTPRKRRGLRTALVTVRRLCRGR